MSGPGNISPADIRKRVELIESMFIEGSDERFKLLIDFAKDFGDREELIEAISHAAAHTLARKEYRQDKIDFEQVQKQRGLIDGRALELLYAISDSPQLKKAA